ncbi:MAG: single-stranded DNA-binding protein [Ruminococcaceae bacterium]|nr:single-stranded DNA-binding protein [Oscillospiraceae bacterium]
MLNVVVLSGRLTADPELKTTANGISVCSFSIAVERRFKSGEERQSDFINIVTWRSSAEFVSKYFKKGQMIAIRGSIQTRRYQDKDGNNRTAFEVVADDVQFADFARREGDAASMPAAPAATPASYSNAGAGDFTSIDDVDEDLPF